jgi:hypothetical protein
MQRLFFFIPVILFLSCTGQTKQTMNKFGQPNLYYPAVTRDFEKFDVKKIDAGTGIGEVKLPDGTIEEYQREPDGYIARVQPANSYFTLIKKFYPSGNIESKGLIFNSGDFNKGKWYFFDSAGKLTREEDNDSAYAFSFEQLYVWIQKEKIPLTIGRVGSGFNTIIRKYTKDGDPQWLVSWLKDVSVHPNTIEVITINGRSGRVVSRQQREYTNN